MRTALWTLCLLSTLSFAATDWRYHARRLTGVSDEARVEALAYLGKTRKLDTTLREALPGTDRYIALDTIAALRRQALLPDLLAMQSADEDGAITLAIASLIVPENSRKIIQSFNERLAAKDLSVPALVATLDTLGRMGHRLDEALIEKYLKSRDYDVQSAALTYARLIILQQKKPLYIDVVRRALADPADALRLQAAYLLSELPFALPAEWKSSAQGCADDKDVQVRDLCRRLGT